jgi:hypothetical protein
LNHVSFYLKHREISDRALACSFLSPANLVIE